MLSHYAAVEEKRAKALNESDLHRRLCCALLKLSEGKGSDFISDLIRIWDKGGKGDLNKTEFRMGVRGAPPNGLGLEVEDHKGVDAIFDDICEKSRSTTGTIEGPIFKTLLESMMSFAKKAVKEEKAILAIAQRLKEKAQWTLATSEATIPYEEEAAKLVHLCNTQPVAVQLGRQIARRNIKIADILIKWDSDASGEVGKKEFRSHVRELGVIAETKAIDACFDSIDTDGGGSLEIEELRSALRDLAKAAKDAKGEEATMEKSVDRLRRMAMRRQADLATTVGPDLNLAREEWLKQKDADNQAAMKIAEKAAMEETEKPAADKDATPTAAGSPGHDSGDAFHKPVSEEVDVTDDDDTDGNKSAVVDGQTDAGAAVDAALEQAWPPRAAATLPSALATLAEDGGEEEY